MCYRYTLQKLESIAAFENDLARSVPKDWKPRYNVTLTSRMPVILWENRPVVRDLSFGFTLPPRSSAERPLLLANSRADTLLAKPTFREAVLHRRCLIPADGFYEWEKQGTTRLPHYFYLREHQPFFLAGIWQPAGESTSAEFNIVTTRPNALLQTIHDRMPVILGPNSGRAWLGDKPLEPTLLDRLCRPLQEEMMRSHRVDPRMNNARYQESDCVTPTVI